MGKMPLCLCKCRTLPLQQADLSDRLGWPLNGDETKLGYHGAYFAHYHSDSS
jgi:hypothetical protein